MINKVGKDFWVEGMGTIFLEPIMQGDMVRLGIYVKFSTWG